MLQIHFRQAHFLCEDGDCLEKKFVVFTNESEMKVIESWHVRVIACLFPTLSSLCKGDLVLSCQYFVPHGAWNSRRDIMPWNMVEKCPAPSAALLFRLLRRLNFSCFWSVAVPVVFTYTCIPDTSKLPISATQSSRSPKRTKVQFRFNYWPVFSGVPW